MIVGQQFDVDTSARNFEHPVQLSGSNKHFSFFVDAKGFIWISKERDRKVDDFYGGVLETPCLRICLGMIRLNLPHVSIQHVIDTITHLQKKFVDFLDYSHPIRFGDVMTVEEFKECCECHAFIDDDGFGYPAKNGMEDQSVIIKPSAVDEIPEGVTHIVWFNK